MLLTVRRRRLVRAIVWAASLLLLVVLGAWAVVAYRLIGHPQLQQPRAADAVIVLGPPEDGGVVEYGEALVNRGLAHALLVSIAPGQRGGYGHMCWDRPPHLTAATLSCFVADPATTRGEARTVSQQVVRNHWHTLLIVTTPYHVERARMLFGRCPTGHLAFVAPPARASAAHWVFESLYQTAGFLKAATEHGC